MPHIFNNSHTIRMGKYESLYLPISFIDDLTGDDIPTTGCTFHIAVKSSIDSTDVLIEATGTDTITFFEEDIRKLSEGEYVYELSVLSNQDDWVELTQAPFILKFGANI